MRTLVTLTGAASLVALSAAAASAAGFEDVVVQPAPVTPAPVVVAPIAEDDWTGFYAGGSVGLGNLDFGDEEEGEDLDGDGFLDPGEDTDGDGVLDGDDDGASDFNSFGVHAGYMQDFGRFVVGGEAEWARLNFNDEEFASDEEDDNNTNITRLKLRAGYDAGNFLPYATIGASRLSTESLGVEIEDTGAVYGVGVDYMFGDNFIIGVEYLRDSFEDFGEDEGEAVGTGVNFDVNTLSLRASFSF